MNHPRDKQFEIWSKSCVCCCVCKNINISHLNHWPAYLTIIDGNIRVNWKISMFWIHGAGVVPFRIYSWSRYTTDTVMSSRNIRTISCGSVSRCEILVCSTPYSVPPSALRMRWEATLASSGVMDRPALENGESEGLK